MSNNLNGPRIADNQTSGHHRAANDALERIDGAVTNAFAVEVTDTNTFDVTEHSLRANFRFVIDVGATSPTDDVTIVLPDSGARGLTFWVNWLSYAATIAKAGQTQPPVVVPSGGYALIDYDGTDARLVSYTQPFYMMFAVGDETTAITTGTSKLKFRMPAQVSITEVRGALVTAQASGSLLAVDVNADGVSIFSTTLTFDNTEKTTTTATTPAVISNGAIADDAEMSIDVDTVGTGAAGLKLTFIGFRY